MPKKYNMLQKSDEPSLSHIASLYSELIAAIGEDESREGLVNTAKRAAKAFRFLTQGYHATLEETVKGALFNASNTEMVLLKDIELFSLCEHHLLPIIGKCHVAYIPNGKIIGLSKIPRIVDMFARRLQVQENLTAQIADSINVVTGALGVGVVIEAEHLCMMARGVEKQNIVVKTSTMHGVFKSDFAVRNEFLSLLTTK